MLSLYNRNIAIKKTTECPSTHMGPPFGANTFDYAETLTEQNKKKC